MPEHVGVAEPIAQAATGERPVHCAAQRRDLQRFIERGNVAHKHCSIRGRRPHMPQILRDGLGSPTRQGQPINARALGAVDCQRTVAPVDGGELQLSHFVAAQTQVYQAAGNCIISLTGGFGAVECL